MGHTLSTGLSDLSRELGEQTVNQTTARIGHYGDAVIQFATEKNWPFLCKENTTLNSSSISSNILDISTITDLKQPDGIKSLSFGTSGSDWIPTDWENRNDERYKGKSFFCIEPDQTHLLFLNTPDAAQTIHLWHYYVPARLTDVTDTTTKYPILDQYRKAIATLAAAFVQWSRYLDGPGNRLYNMYDRMLGKATTQQTARPAGNPRRMTHFLQHKGFRRTYP